MKLIILAAGEGTRLKHLTTHLPKGMLPFNGKPIVEWQIMMARKCGIEDIVIVIGFEKDKISFKGVKYYHNADYSTTNMVESLFCAEEELNGDVIVSYADILYEERLLQKVIASSSSIGVAVDMDWTKYWRERYGTVDHDLESLTLNGDKIIELGKENPPVEAIDARYIGLTRFNKSGLETLKSTYYRYKREYTGQVWQQSGKTFENAYMTDMLNQILEDGHSIKAIKSEGGWLEFDTVEDYEFSKKVLEDVKYQFIFNFASW
ncbi:MAG: phosphocholine cytidylyltransferase family protein [Ekhidna sp.]|nr:phosphocholine cytidylyltransferase family protein [Ekhidna sp.]